ncbi:MAG TPA: 4-alpha-glucanotransferase [Gemmatimonadaceae bacterium]|nr:4-alpha-glucanotransferase [Gemmatimonadaceae bacterium]
MGSALRELADRVGIIPEYLDQTGQETRVTSDDTRRTFLDAMGIDAGSDAAAQRSLDALISDERKSLVDPVRVVERDDPRARCIEVHAPATRGSSGPWRMEITQENGERHVSEGPWRGDATLELNLPDLRLGYHRLRLSMGAGGDEWSTEQSLIVVPPRCVVPDEMLDGGNAFGLIANLYTIRSSTNWGIGDFSDLRRLAAWAAENGADFVGVNPLHALMNHGDLVSPYSPVSRLFRNPIYIDPSRLPEVRENAELRERVESPELEAQRDALRETPHVRYEQVMATKGLVLDAAHKLFLARGRGTDRAREYERYVSQSEPALTRFAMWMTFAEEHGPDWRSWPAELRDAHGAGAAAAADRHRDRVDYHRWLQFEADRQLGDACTAARDGGMRLGLYQDLAIGTSSSGADAWAFPDLFIQRASIGAPPDPYSASGQNWGLPPIDPRALRRNCYRYFIDLVRSGFRNAGALRIDHVMGLFRLFWIPEGRCGSEGAYVRYPSSDLLGIVALESVRNHGIVVGEDLGTVPHDVPPALNKWGVLSSKVLYFERGWHGSFKPADSYPRLALATANTHDVATIAGFWQGRDIEVRREVGLIENDHDAGRAHGDRDVDRRELLNRLAEEHVLPRSEVAPTSVELRAAVHGFLCRTPAQLVGLALDDLAGETEPVNVPGVGPDRFPSWTRKMRDPLEVIMTSDETQIALRCDGRRGVRS